MKGRYERRMLLRWSSASVLGLAGCAAPVAQTDQGDPETGADAWPEFRFDARNTGYAPGRERTRINPSPTWTFETGGPVWGSPVTDGDLVYIGSYDHELYALDPSSGDPEWRFETGDRVDSTPAVADGTVYFGSFDGHLYALDAATGDEHWSYDAHGRIRGSPTVVDGTVYFGANCKHLECDWYYEDEPHEHGHVFALDAATGEAQWEFTTGDGIMSTPAVYDGTLFIGSSDGGLYALDLADGSERWVHEADDWVMSSPAVADDTVYVGSNDGNVYALDVSTGDERWVFDTGATYVSSSPSIYDGTVFIGSSGVVVENAQREKRLRGILYALSADSGKEEWSFQTEAQEVGSAPSIVDDTIYVGSHSQNMYYGGLYAVDRDGGMRWVHQTDDEGVGATPMILDGTVYFGDSNGVVYALG